MEIGNSLKVFPLQPRCVEIFQNPSVWYKYVWNLDYIFSWISPYCVDSEGRISWKVVFMPHSAKKKKKKETHSRFWNTAVAYHNHKLTP